MSENIIKEIENIGVVPVVVIDNADDSIALAEALINGGLPCAEVTFRTSAAEEAIRRISKAFPQMLLGAGTVLTVQQAEKAVNAGAKFLVSPGYDQNLVEWARLKNIPYFPGVCTASEVQIAVANGLTDLKFFPAEASGGVGMIKNLCGPFPQVRFMTTGGISMNNIAEYGACKNVLAVGGSWMVKADMVANHEWDKITSLCKEAALAIHGFKFMHIGINNNDEKTAMDGATRFALFGLPIKDGNSSIFMNTDIELMKSKGFGVSGHIAFGTYNVDRAVAYLTNYGFTVKEESVKKDAKGKMTVCYFNEEINGFAIHLVQRKE